MARVIYFGLSVMCFLSCLTEAQLDSWMSTRIVQTKYGLLRGVVYNLSSKVLDPVEAFLGIPYASAPIGHLRHMPPATPALWTGVRLSDKMASVCPQKFPSIKNRTRALESMPRERYDFLKQIEPKLKNQSEDCLYMNIYVPSLGSGSDPNEKLAVMMYIHGESFEWGSGNLYDGSVMASFGRIIVVTVNYRLGIFGFLKTGNQKNLMGNFGLLDLIAALQWIKENIVAFGGDNYKITIVGHDTGASLANLLLLSPVTKGMIHRAALLSGSALSPWAFCNNPLSAKMKVAKAFKCNFTRIESADITPCLRRQSVSDLLAFNMNSPTFISNFSPFVDGSTVLADPEYLMRKRGAVFKECSLFAGSTITESFLDFTSKDINVGFEEDKRDRILRTFVRNTFYYHLNEIFATIVNEYTDWEKPIQHPISIRDAVAEALSDGHTLAPLMSVVRTHAQRNPSTYFYVFEHQSPDGEFPQRLGTCRGEDIPFIFGAPFLSKQFPSYNFTKADLSISEAYITYLTNFVKTGNPNEPIKQSISYGSNRERSRFKDLDWPTFDKEEQKYISFASRPKVKNHYRGHKLALWLNLIPTLHVPGDESVSMVHHHFFNDSEELFEGIVRPHSLTKPAPLPTLPPTTEASSVSTVLSTSDVSEVDIAAVKPTFYRENRLRETYPSITHFFNGNESDPNFWNFPKTFFKSYTMALVVTIAIGCSLLVLNLLICAGVYYQRDKTRMEAKLYKMQFQGKLAQESCSSDNPIIALSHFPNIQLTNHVPPQGILKMGSPVKVNHVTQTNCPVQNYPERKSEGTSTLRKEGTLTRDGSSQRKETQTVRWSDEQVIIQPLRRAECSNFTLKQEIKRDSSTEMEIQEIRV